jgi:protein involved in polysaccharide export with SLBB domain
VKLGFVPLVAALLLTFGCASAPPHPVDLPAPLEATTLGVGDVFVLRIVGEDKLPTDFTVAPDGSADLPYIKRVNVEGLEPQELAEAVRRKLVEGQILTDPSVSISVKEYNSKRVEVIGEVQKPGSIPLQPGMRLLRVLAIAGGFNTLANKNRVTIRRKMKGGATKVVTVSVQEIIDNQIPDPPLQSGDSINVEQRVF